LLVLPFLLAILQAINIQGCFKEDISSYYYTPTLKNHIHIDDKIWCEVFMVASNRRKLLKSGVGMETLHGVVIWHPTNVFGIFGQRLIQIIHQEDGNLTLLCHQIMENFSNPIVDFLNAICTTFFSLPRWWKFAIKKCIACIMFEANFANIVCF